MDFAKQASRFKPIVFGWCQDGMVASQAFDKLSFGQFGRSPAQLCQHHG